MSSRGSERKGQRRGEALFRRRPDVIKTSVSGPAATAGNVHSCDAAGEKRTSSVRIMMERAP